jgi:hypothetical protein
MNPDSLPESKHFYIASLARGVNTVIGRDGGWAISNAGIVVLGDRTLVFCTLMALAATADLRHAAE